MTKKITYFLLCFALLFNSFAPAFVSASSVESDIDALRELYGDDGKVLICTSYGYKYVSLEDLAEEKEKNQSSDNHCPLCILSAIKADLSFKNIGFLEIFPPENEAAFYLKNESKKLSKNFSTHKQTRAPPVFS